MFPVQCNERHENSFKVSCCIIHLIEMHFFAENQTLRHKYAKLLTITLNHHFKRNQLNFDKIKPESAKIFLAILSQYTTYYYCMNEVDLAKLLTKISLMLIDDASLSKSNLEAEFTKTKSAVYNNLSCIYEKLENYSKSMQYLKSTYKLLNSPGNSNKTVDMAIFYNNFARISLKQNELSSAGQAMKISYELFREGSLQLMQERHTLDKNFTSVFSAGDYNNSQSMLRLYGFLYLNYGCFLSNFKHCHEIKAVDVFLQGYEYCKSLLNEHDEIFSKIRYKLQFANSAAKILKQNTFMLNETFDSRYDSEVELPQIKTRSWSSKRTNSQENLEKNRHYTSTSMDKPDKSKITNSENRKTSEKSYEDMNEIKHKVDQLLNKFEEFKRYASTSPIVKKNSGEVKIDTNKELKQKLVHSPKYESLKRMIKPTINRLIDEYKANNTGDNNPRSPISRQLNQLSSIKKKSTSFTEEYLQELVKEFENVKETSESKIIKNFENSKPRKCSLVGNLKPIKNQQYSNDIDMVPREISKTPQNPRRRLKDIFSRMIPEETLKNLNSKKEDDGKLFTKLVSSLVNDEESLVDNMKRFNPVSIQVKGEISRDKTATIARKFQADEKKTFVRKENVFLFENNMQEKGEDSLKNIDTIPQDHTHESKITITITKDEDSCDLYEAKTYYSKVSDAIQNQDSNTKAEIQDRKISYLEDNSNVQALQQGENKLNNTMSIENLEMTEIKAALKNYASSFSIKVDLDEEEDFYRPKTYYRKRQCKPVSNENTPVQQIEEKLNSNINKESVFEENSKINLVEHTFPEKQENNNINHNQGVILTEEDINLTKEKESFITFTLNQGIRRMITLDNLQNEMLTKSDDPLKTKFLHNKKKNMSDFKKYIENLVLIYESNTELKQKKIFTIIRELENSLYKIALSIEKNDKRDIGLQFRLLKKNSEEILSQSFITFEKLKNSEAKLNLQNSLSTFDDLYKSASLEDFVRKTVIFNCHLYKKEKSLSIGLLTRPIGLCANSLYEFTFLNTLCFIDILVIQSTEIKFIVYNRKK